MLPLKETFPYSTELKLFFPVLYDITLLPSLIAIYSSQLIYLSVVLA